MKDKIINYGYILKKYDGQYKLIHIGYQLAIQKC